MSESNRAPRLPWALTAPRGSDPSHILPRALLAAVALHLFLILTVSFDLTPPDRQTLPEAALEVLLLRDAGETTPAPEPDAALSQRSRVGESPRGEAVASAALDEPPHPTRTPADAPPLDDDDPDPTATGPAPPPPAPAAPAEPRRETPPTPLAAPPTRKAQRAPKVPETPPAPPPAEPPPKPVDASQILASRDQEVTRLTTTGQGHSGGAGRPRRKAVSASTREFRYANYLGAWARKVENIGNLNYPQAAKEQHLYGNLILDVAVRADGSVEQIRVVHSSGYPLLDQAAIQIVQLAAPYSPFPPDIAAETDVLDIVRTWQFLRGDKLGWEQ